MTVGVSGANLVVWPELPCWPAADQDFGVGGVLGSRIVLNTSARTDFDFVACAWRASRARLRFFGRVRGEPTLSNFRFASLLFVFDLVLGPFIRLLASSSWGRRLPPGESLLSGVLAVLLAANAPQEPATEPAKPPGNPPLEGALRPVFELCRVAVVQGP